MMFKDKAAMGIRQVFGESPRVLGDVLQDGVNLAVWQRRLAPQVEDFARLLIGLDHPLTYEQVMDVNEDKAPVLGGLLNQAADLHGYEGFVADVAWLVAAYTCLLDARRVGLRLRVLEGPMCPLFHVDKVPLRLLTTYTGLGSEWLPEGCSDRSRLQLTHIPVDNIRQLQPGDVALLKGERWPGNEGRGLVHRSPGDTRSRRLLLSLDWLA